MEERRKGLTSPPKEFSRHISWTHILDNMAGRQTGERVLLNHKTFDWNRIQNSNY